MPPLPGLRASSLPPAPGYESDEEGGLCNKQKTSTSVFERTFENNNSNNNCTLIPLPGTRGNRNYDYEEEIARHDRSKEEPPLPSLSLRREKGLFREACAGETALARPPIHTPVKIALTGGPRYGPISISIKGGAHVPPPRKCPPHKRSGREDARSLRINDTRGV